MYHLPEQHGQMYCFLLCQEIRYLCFASPAARLAFPAWAAPARAFPLRLPESLPATARAFPLQSLPRELLALPVFLPCPSLSCLPPVQSVLPEPPTLPVRYPVPLPLQSPPVALNQARRATQVVWQARRFPFWTWRSPPPPTQQALIPLQASEAASSGGCLFEFPDF